MAPLPCSPVSNSTASESQSLPTSEDSDDSLITPRPGPSDPALRTQANLSRPSIPAFSSSPESPRSPRSPRSTGKLPTGATSPVHLKKDNHSDIKTDGRPRNPYTYGTSPKRIASGTSIHNLGKSDRNKSISFSPQALEARRSGSYGSDSMSRRHSPNLSPHERDQDNGDGGLHGAESSADENTAIFPRDRLAGSGRRDYGATAGEVGDNDEDVDEPPAVYEATRSESGLKRRKTSSSRSGRGGRAANTTASAGHTTDGNDADGEGSDHEGWFRSMLDKYGSVELENKGSVARDHLALERTFLAWLRTSLSFASIGIAVTQLFRLNSTLNSDSASSSAPTLLADTHRLRQVGKPLGATFLGISILILIIGFHRYFESQHYVIRGKFPASRGSIILVSLVAFALIVTSLVVVVAIAPSAFEKK